MTTLFDAMLRTAQLLKETWAGTSNGTGTGQLVDSNCVEPSDYFNGGTLFVQSGTYIGNSYVITDFTSTGGKFDIAQAQASGVAYTAFTAHYTKQALKNAVNMALSHIGRVMDTDESLTTIANTVEYSLATAGVSDIRRVQVASGADWKTVSHWLEADGKLVFGVQPNAGTTLKLWYAKLHGALSADTDVISAEIDTARLAWTAAYYATHTRAQYSEQGEPAVKELNKVAGQMMMALAAKNPVRLMHRDAILPTWSTYDGQS